MMNVMNVMTWDGAWVKIIGTQNGHGFVDAEEMTTCDRLCKSMCKSTF